MKRALLVFFLAALTIIASSWRPLKVDEEFFTGVVTKEAVKIQ